MLEPLHPHEPQSLYHLHVFQNPCFQILILFRLELAIRIYSYNIVNRRPPLTIDKNKAWVVHKKLDTELMNSASKFFIGNQYVGFPMAEALKVPRILEAEPDFPVVQPIGKNAFDFYYQPHFEKWCKYLNNKF